MSNDQINAGLTPAKRSRNCRKCGARIPTRIKINGVYKNIQNRKFCLTCSLFGAHNTKKDDPARPAKKSDSNPDVILSRKIAWRASAEAALQRARVLKQELITLSGGKCIKCGYARYAGALEFHHTDPKSKLFSLGISNIKCKLRELVLEEWKKCILLCSNCHRETEYTNL